MPLPKRLTGKNGKKKKNQHYGHSVGKGREMGVGDIMKWKAMLSEGEQRKKELWKVGTEMR